MIDIAALRAKALPRLNWRDLFKVSDGATIPQSDQDAMAAYFRRFAKPAKGGLCLCCGAPQGSTNVLDAFLGTGKFVWGIAHGEGYCSACGYPARAAHYNVGPVESLRLILQYHPDEVRLKSEAKEPA